MLDMFSAHHLLKSGQSAKVHVEVDQQLKHATQEERIVLSHIRTHAFLYEKRFEEALDHVNQSRKTYGCETLAHQTRAMIFELIGNESGALHELETAPYEREADIFPLLVDDAYFYMSYFKTKKNMLIDIDYVKIHYPDDFGTYLPHQGNMRGVHVSKADLVRLHEELIGTE